MSSAAVQGWQMCKKGVEGFGMMENSARDGLDPDKRRIRMAQNTEMAVERVEEIILSAGKVFGSRKIKPGKGWDARSLAEALVEQCEKNKVQLELALAQGWVECHFGFNPAAQRSRKTLNIFNVGNVDSGKNRNMTSWEDGIRVYCELMRREYNWDEGEYITLESMKKHDFYRPRGGRYATAPGYTDLIWRLGVGFRKKLEG